jgi:outer membrane protein OmpA-like peptidoglycan-associated protein/predicted  nucleic acid-binding Zn-ribbon protein
MTVRGWLRAPLLVTSALFLLAIDDLAALPIAKPKLPAAPVVLVQDRNEGAPAAPVETTPFDELNESLAAARARLEELSKAADVAAAAARLRRELAAVKAENQSLKEQLVVAGDSRQRMREAEERIASLTVELEAANQRTQQLEQQLTALNWRDAQLNTTLERAQAAREQAEREAAEIEAATGSKIEALTRSVEESAAEIARLGEELQSSEQRLATATGAKSDAEARLVEIQEVQNQEAAAIDRLQGELEEARAEASNAIEERDRALAAQATAQHELEVARAELEQLRVASDRLETEVTALRAAANTATVAARQNLAAMVTRIEELNEALAVVEGDEPAAVVPAAGPDDQPTDEVVEVEQVAEAQAQVVEAEQAADVQAEDVAEAEAAADTPTDAASGLRPSRSGSFGPAPLPPVATAANDRATESDLDLIKSADAAIPPVDSKLAQLTADLPLEKRLQVQSLAADLEVKTSDEGLIMTVPGASLFALNSDRIQRSAHDTLAKVAELIDVYDDRRILIRGHTDSVGEASYNQQLSERRAELVKEFFVDNFEIEEGRLASTGLGERRPIATNATLDGRRANRRVEVVILE